MHYYNLKKIFKNIFGTGVTTKLNSYAAGCVSLASFNNEIAGYNNINFDFILVVFAALFIALITLLGILISKKINSFLLKEYSK